MMRARRSIISVALQPSSADRFFGGGTSQHNAQRVANRHSQRLVVRRIVKTESTCNAVLVGLHPDFPCTDS